MWKKRAVPSKPTSLEWGQLSTEESTVLPINNTKNKQAAVSSSLQVVKTNTVFAQHRVKYGGLWQAPPVSGM